MSGSPVIAVQAPEKADVALPAEPALLAMFDAVLAKEISPYDDRVATAPLVADPPAPGRITAETRHDAITAVEWTLSNGARVFVKSTDFKNDEVLFTGFSPGGTSLAPDSSWLDAQLATLATAQGGLGAMSLVELQKALAGNTANVSPFIGEMQESLTGQASPSDLETLLQLAYLRFTSPRRDTASFQAMLANVKASIANRDADPRTAFNDTIQVTLAQHHPRARPIDAAQIDRWSLDRSLAFYRDRFADAGDFTFIFVGNVEPDQLRPLVEQWLAALPTTGREESGGDLGIRPPDGVVEKTVRRGVEPKSETRITFTGPFEFTRENRHLLASLAAVVDVRLRDVLREDLGGTYGVQVAQATANQPVPGYTFNVGFGADPNRLETLVETVFAEIEKLATDGPDAETVANVQETQRRSWETNQTQNGFWLSQIAFTARTGGEFALIPDYPQMVDALTADAIREAARQYLRRDRYVRVSLYPQ
jgi:zinc protease